MQIERKLLNVSTALEFENALSENVFNGLSVGKVKTLKKFHILDVKNIFKLVDNRVSFFASKRSHLFIIHLLS